MSQKNTEAPTASTTAEDLEAVKMQAVEDAKNAEKQRMESIKAVFAGNGLENNSKMNELLMDMDSGEIDALKACAEILKNSLEEAKSSAHQKTLAEKELEQRAQDDNDLQGVCNPSESNGGESNFDAQAFVNGYDSVARGDIGG
jgi:predicted RNase H-like nuclease (RuvC/YqgF family)